MTTTALRDSAGDGPRLIASVDDRALGGAGGHEAVYAPALAAPGRGPVVARIEPAAATVQPGGTARWTVRLVNTGTEPVAGPASVTFSVTSVGRGGAVTASPAPGWACAAAARCVWSAALAGGASTAPLAVSAVASAPQGVFDDHAVSLFATVEAAGRLGSTAAATSPLVDGDVAHVEVEMTPSATTVPVGAAPRWTARLRNVGQVPARGTVALHLGEDLAPVTVAPPVGAGVVCDGGDCTWTVDLASGAATPALEVTATSAPAQLGTVRLLARWSDTGAGGVLTDATTTSVVPVTVAQAPAVQPFVVQTGGPRPLSAAEVPAWQVRLVSTGTRPTTGRTRVVVAGVDGGVSVTAGPGWSCIGLVCVTDAVLSPSEVSPLLAVRGAGADPAEGVDVVVTDPAGATTRTSAAVSRAGGQPGPDLAVQTAVLGQPVDLAGTLRSRTVVRNVGDAALTGAQVQVSLPGDGSATPTVTAPGWTCSGASFLVCRTEATLAPGQAAPAIDASLPAGGLSRTVPEEVRAFVFSDDDADFSDNQSSAAAVLGPVRADAFATVTAAVVDRDRVWRRVLTVGATGDTPVSGPVKVFWSDEFGSSGFDVVATTAATGTGWTCRPTERSCTHPGPVPAGGALPPITVATRADALPGTLDASTRIRTTVSLSAAGDQSRDGDPASVTSGVVGRPRVAVVPVLAFPRGAAPAGRFRSDVVVTSVGSGTATGPTTLQVQAPVAVTASGTGWTCDNPGPTFVTCTTTVAPPRAGTLPPVTLVGSGTATSGQTQFGVTVTTADDGVPAFRAGATVVQRAAVVELVPVVTARWRADGTGRLLVDVADAGPQPSSGRITVSVDAVAAQAATGPGWTCTAAVFAGATCTTDAVVPVGGSAPQLVVRLAPRTEVDSVSFATVTVSGGGDDPTGVNSVFVSDPRG